MASHLQWFSLLRPSDNEAESPDPLGKGSPKGLLDTLTPDSRMLVVCQQVALQAGGEPVRRFAAFPTYLEFARFHLREVRPTHRCFYEVIFGHLPQKPYFDLDIKLEGPMSLTRAAEVADEVIRGLLAFLPIASSDIMLLTSHGPTKASYHIIVDHWCVANAAENRALALEVMSQMSEEYRPYVDLSMYKSIQQLRIFGSHKWASERTKILGPSAWRPPVEPSSEDHLFVLILGGSLVGKTSTTKLLPSLAVEAPKRDFGDSPDLTKAEIGTALDLCAAAGGLAGYNDGRFPYKFQEVKGSMILLKRLRPSRCQICDRVHEAENPFLTVTAGGEVLFHCRRDPTGTSLRLGKLERLIPSEPEVPVPPSPNPSVKETLAHLTAERAHRRLSPPKADPTPAFLAAFDHLGPPSAS